MIEAIDREFVVERVQTLASLGEVSLGNIDAEHHIPDWYTLLQNTFSALRTLGFSCLSSSGWGTLTFFEDRYCFERLWTVLEGTLA